MKNDIFRKAALEKIATVDQLDRILKVTSPLSWLALLGVLVIIVMVVTWSIVGTLPATITASGVIVSSTASTNTYLAQTDGTVELLVHEGDFIRINQPVVRMTHNGAVTEGLSDQNGYVSTILVTDGTTVNQGKELFRISPYVSAGQKQVVVSYVPVHSVDKIKRGMDANITLTSADSSTYGHMVGRVINIDTWATSTEGIEAVVGSGNNMAAAFVKDSSVCAVTLELYLPGEGIQSRSGYFWSNEKGYQLEINDRMMCSVKIITKEEHPITRLFAKLKQIWGE